MGTWNKTGPPIRILTLPEQAIQVARGTGEHLRGLSIAPIRATRIDLQQYIGVLDLIGGGCPYSPTRWAAHVPPTLHVHCIFGHRGTSWSRIASVTAQTMNLQ